MVRFDEDLPTKLTHGELIAEGAVLCEFEGLLLGIAVWLSSYYVFNLEYPKGASKTLIFIQKCIVGIEDRLKKPIIVSTAFDKLRKAL